MNKAVNISGLDIPGNFQWLLATHVVFCPYIEIFNTFLYHHYSSFPDPRKLLCIPIGFNPSKEKIKYIMPLIKNKKIILLMPDDLLGRIADIKIAVWLKNHDVRLTYRQPGTIQIAFKNKTYHFPEHKISLSAFQKESGFRSKIRTYKIDLPDVNAYSASFPQTS